MTVYMNFKINVVKGESLLDFGKYFVLFILRILFFNDIDFYYLPVHTDAFLALNSQMMIRRCHIHVWTCIFCFQANCEMNEVPVFNIEPVWQQVRGPSSLVEQAVEQRVTNYGLLTHHYNLAVIMSAVLTFGMKSAKVLSLFDSKVCQTKNGVVQR
jgi:hypothetical protein